RHLSLVGGKVEDRFPKKDFGDDKPVTESEDSFEVRNEDLAKDEENPPSSPYKDSTKVALSVLYRGRIIPNEPTITIHHGADITILRHPEPTYAGIAMWADPKTLERFALSQGALDIVVDYSGSMLGRKIKQAHEALRELLENLPDGVR